jgi:uncharacterized RDD family membrane protein YckC
MADFNPYQTPAAQVGDVAEFPGALAGRGRRLAASLVDGLLIGILLAVLAIFLAPGLFTGAQPPFLKMVFLGFITLSLWVALNYPLLARNGQTIGKKALGIKIVRSDFSPCKVGRIFGLRFLVPGLINQIPLAGALFALVDVLFIFQESRRCLHDLIADTVVVTA